MLVVDASTAVAVSLHSKGFARFGAEELVAPPMLWPEVRSVLHEMQWRGQLTRDVAKASLEAFHAASIDQRNPRGLGQRAWRIADDFGWAKTYDAEYVALAELIGCRLVTLDGRLRRATARLGFVVALDDL